MAGVFTEPPDLTAEQIGNALASGWSFRAISVDYLPVGFGSHHWLAVGADGTRLFLTADDLAGRRRHAADTADAAFGRLRQALEAALSLRAEVGLGFVVAPVPTTAGAVVSRPADRYSLAVHPWLTGQPAGRDGEFATAADRKAVLDLLVVLHTVRPARARPAAEDFTLPLAAGLRSAIGQTGQSWTAGPYGPPARDLLARNAEGVTALLAAYRVLADVVAGQPDRMTCTHGEPHSANVLRTAQGYLLVDWDTVLLAPPERDLWVLAESDAAIPAAYTVATGIAVDQDAMTFYRLRYDLAEIASYICLFRAPHGDSADSAESWRNLRHFLRPEQRWPALMNPAGQPR